MSHQRHRVLGYVTFVMVTLGLIWTFVLSPTEKVMGDVQRIFYFHVASAWNAFLAFFVVFVASILYLKTRERRWDLLGYCSAEVGVVFTTIVLLTGPVWAKPIWLTWWTWDPRLTTTLILWFIYLAYLVIRSTAEGSESQARLAAIFGIIGFLDVPLVFVSARWWRSIHPVLVQKDKMNMEPPMVVAMILAVLSFTLLYAYLASARMRIERLAQEAQELKEALRSR